MSAECSASSQKQPSISSLHSLVNLRKSANDFRRCIVAADFGTKKNCASLGCLAIAGIDEAGRGALAGPVVAAAVILPEKFRHRRLNDSKQLRAGIARRNLLRADRMPKSVGRRHRRFDRDRSDQHSARDHQAMRARDRSVDSIRRITF